MADDALRGTWADITRSTTPMWRSVPVPPPYEQNWIRNMLVYWINFKQEHDEPEIHDYMRVSKGL